MIPHVFQTLNSSSAVKALFGSKPLRIFPWAQAPEKVTKPYATYAIFNGDAENYLGNLPDIDRQGTQFDIWAENGKSCEDCFIALRDALEPLGHMVSFQQAVKDAETQLYNARLEFDFWTPR